jgi:pyruvate-formate lyase
MSNGIAKGGPDTACAQNAISGNRLKAAIARRAERQKHINSTPQNWSMGVQWPRDISKPKMTAQGALSWLAGSAGQAQEAQGLFGKLLWPLHTIF